MSSSRPLPSAPPDTLLSASQKNLPDLIKEMVQVGGINPSHANAVGQSALHIAALWGHLEAMAALVELGANVNAKNKMTGASPLHMAAQSHKIESISKRAQVIDLLLEAGADINLADNYGGLPIHCLTEIQQQQSLSDEDERTLSLLMERLQPERPPLYEAIVERNVEKVLSLLEADNSLSNVEHQGQTPIGFVTDKIIESVQKQQKQTEDPNLENLQKLKEILDLLLSHGGNPNRTATETKNQLRSEIDDDDEDDTLPLTKIACLVRETYKIDCSLSTELIPFLHSVVQSLIEKGKATVSKDTALLAYQAARRNELAFLKFLIEDLQVDPNTAGPQDMTPLHFAARSGHMDVLRFLLQQPNLDVNAKDNRGKTALDGAEVNNKTEAIEELKRFSS